MVKAAAAIAFHRIASTVAPPAIEFFIILREEAGAIGEVMRLLQRFQNADFERRMRDDF